MKIKNCLISLMLISLFMALKETSAFGETMNAMRCYDQGYIAGVKYSRYGTTVPEVAGCNVQGSIQKEAFTFGVGYVLRYGEVKTPSYYDVRAAYMLRESQLNAQGSNLPAKFVNNTSEQDGDTSTEANQAQQNSSSSNLINTGVQILRSIIGY